jgi:hypothetical protein
MSFVWSPAALDQLHRLYVIEGLSASQVARALSAAGYGGAVTRNAVLGKTQRLGWTRPKVEAAPPTPRAAQPTAARARTEQPRSPFARRIPLPKLREIDPPGAPRPWTERQPGECAFPVGEPDAQGQRSCCAPAQAGGAYCAAHRALMTLPSSTMTDKDQDAILEIARRAA